MMKRTIIRMVVSALVLMAPAFLHAATTTQYLQITEKNSTDTVFFKLSAKPVLTCNSDTLKATDGTTSVAVALSKVIDYRFVEKADVVTGINTVKNQDSNAAITSGEAIFSNLKAGTPVRVYTVDGRLVSTYVASPDGRVRVDFSNFKPGVVYILRTPTNSYKVINK